MSQLWTNRSSFVNLPLSKKRRNIVPHSKFAKRPVSLEKETLSADNFVSSPPSFSQNTTILALYSNIYSDKNSEDEFDNKEASLIGYSVLAAPETVKIPYPLRSGRKTVSIPDKNIAKKMVSRPYLSQI